MPINLRGSADSDFDNSVTIDRANAADACVRVQQAGTTNLTLFANGSVDCSGIVIGAGGMTLNGVPVRNAWAQNEIIQTQVFSDNGTGNFSMTAMGSVQQTQFNFTPRSTNSTIVFEYWFSTRTANVAATNTEAIYRIRTSYGNGPSMISASFSVAGDDGIDDIASMMVFFNNTATNQIFALLDGSVSGSGASARCRDITCKITEIQN